MDQIIVQWHWFQQQTIVVQAMFSVGCLNVAVAGLKQLGLTQAADFCQKLENAFLAMTAAGQAAFTSEIVKPLPTKIGRPGSNPDPNKQPV